MLTEVQVLQSVAAHLAQAGFKVQQLSGTSERGTDLIAVSPDGGWTLVVEGKGETTSKPGSNRYGKPFGSSQVFTHIAKAFFSTAAAVSGEQEGPIRAAMALPNTMTHGKYLRKVEVAIRRLGIGVFLVSPDRTVQEFIPIALDGDFA